MAPEIIFLLDLSLIFFIVPPFNVIEFIVPLVPNYLRLLLIGKV